MESSHPPKKTSSGSVSVVALGGRRATVTECNVATILSRGHRIANSYLFFLTFLETSSLEDYHEFEVSKYKIFSRCSTHGYYTLRTSCISRPRTRGSFRDLKFPRKSREKVGNSQLGVPGTVAPKECSCFFLFRSELVPQHKFL